MVRHILALVLLAALLPLAGYLSLGAQAGRFLDLPDGFSLGEQEEEEPELIEFYAEQYQGDAFFFCLDRSGSMSEPATGGATKFEVLKRETVNALSTLTERTMVSVVFYDRSLKPLVYGDPPEHMDPPGKARMVARIVATPIGQGTCLLRGMCKTLDLARKVSVDNRTIILTGDGRTTCPNGVRDPDAIFQSIMAHNVLRIPINTVYTGSQDRADWAVGKPLLERIARATGGKFRVAY